jgi:hypothetical protein
MRVELYGVVFETPCLSFYLWTPWRATILEHKLFEAVAALPGVRKDGNAEELSVHVTDAKTVRAALTAVARVLKGWQEEAEMGGDRRTWRWLIDGDTNADGYDHNGEEFSLWGILRASLERGSPGEAEKGEDIDLEGFGLRVWGEKGNR